MSHAKGTRLGNTVSLHVHVDSSMPLCSKTSVKVKRKNNIMRANPRDDGGAPARYGVVQAIDTATKAASLVSGIYNAGKVILPYVRPTLTALAAAA